MIKYFCDKCGKEVGDFNMNEIFTIKVEPAEVRAWMDEAETGTYILCYDCVQKLNKWIKEKEGSKDPSNIYPIVAPDHKIPEACKTCSNHPSNGGSGICNCTLGTPEVKC